MGEFVNCIDGLFSSALSAENIEVEILPQFSYENQMQKAVPMYCLYTLMAKEVSLYIAVDSDVSIGQMPVTRKDGS